MRRRRPVLTSAAAAGLAFGGVAPAAALQGLPTTTIHLGTADGFSRIEFQGAQPVAVRREAGGVIVLRFGRIAAPDLSLLHADPPPTLRKAEARTIPAGMEVRLTLAADAAATLGRADGATFVNVHNSATPAVTKETTSATGATRPDPAPASGVVRMASTLNGRTLRLAFPWRAPLGAAVFRRGQAVWIVFDTHAELDLSAAPHGLPQFGPARAVEGSGWSAVRLDVPAAVPVSAAVEGATWTVSLGPAAQPAPAPIHVAREASDAGERLTAQLAGATGVFWIDDPVVGDRFAAVTARGPTKAFASAQAYVDATLPRSAQGLFVEPARDDLTVAADGDVVRIGRPNGLSLSPTATSAVTPSASAGPDLPGPAHGPAVVDAAWARTGPRGFLARYDQLMTAAAEEGGVGRGGPVVARLGLARFLAASGLSFEAIGVLDALAKDDQTIMADASFRGLRGAARVMAGRYKDAAADFSAPVLASDSSSALWRGYVAVRLGDWTGARQAFEAGRPALGLFGAPWRGRFALAEAEAALAGGDLGAARGALQLARAEPMELADADALRLDQARLAQASGQDDQALALFQTASASAWGAVAAPATLGAVELKLAHGRISPGDAAQALDALRFRWRGDATELQTARALGRLYLAQGRFRDALDALRSAGRSLPDMPEAAGLRADLSDTFRKLFLDGGADGLQPIQALALFDEFRELTPIGADGDLMVRRLTRRLVDVDLLPQAAALLKYQVDNRLDGVPKAEVATDLAGLLLMDHRPEEALDAINGSRTTLLPAALNARRRVLEARALLGLGRFDHALELVGEDVSSDALDLRGEIAWRRQSWGEAGAALEAALGDRWRGGTPLDGDDRRRLLRAAVAYSLARDDGALARLRTRWGKLAEAASAPDALRVALAGVTEPGPQAPRLTGADLGRVTSDDDVFAGWVGRMKSHLLAGG